MILGRTLAAAIAFILLATAAASAVVAAAFALYLGFSSVTGPAWAAAIVAAIFGLIVIIAALVAANQGHGHHDHDSGHSDLGLGFVERIIEMGKERPILSVGAGIAALMIAIRNPALVATIAAAFMDRPKDQPSSRRRR